MFSIVRTSRLQRLEERVANLEAETGLWLDIDLGILQTPWNDFNAPNYVHKIGINDAFIVAMEKLGIEFIYEPGTKESAKCIKKPVKRKAKKED